MADFFGLNYNRQMGRPGIIVGAPIVYPGSEVAYIILSEKELYLVPCHFFRTTKKQIAKMQQPFHYGMAVEFEPEETWRSQEDPSSPCRAVKWVKRSMRASEAELVNGKIVLSADGVSSGSELWTPKYGYVQHEHRPGALADLPENLPLALRLSIIISYGAHEGSKEVLPLRGFRPTFQIVLESGAIHLIEDADFSVVRQAPWKRKHARPPSPERSEEQYPPIFFFPRQPAVPPVPFPYPPPPPLIKGAGMASNAMPPHFWSRNPVPEHSSQSQPDFMTGDKEAKLPTTGIFTTANGDNETSRKQELIEAQTVVENSLSPAETVSPGVEDASSSVDPTELPADNLLFFPPAGASSHQGYEEREEEETTETRQPLPRSLDGLVGKLQQQQPHHEKKVADYSSVVSETEETSELPIVPEASKVAYGLQQWEEETSAAAPFSLASEVEQVADNKKEEIYRDASPSEEAEQLLADYLVTPIPWTPCPLLRTFDMAGVAAYIREHHPSKIIFMVGAGISTSANIPDFRSPGTGLFAQKGRFKLADPKQLFTLNYFKRNPKPFYQLARELFFRDDVRPTLCHHFIKLVEEKGMLLRCFTQNIDMLESAVGLSDERVVTAHGSAHTSTCLTCGQPYTEEWLRQKLRCATPVVPQCSSCGGERVKPDITFYGELLPQRFEAATAVDFPQCDLLIIAGTSLVVDPFCSLIKAVPEECPRLLINLEEVRGFEQQLRYGLPNNTRDAFWAGTCDEGVMALAKHLGWDQELAAMKAAADKQPVSDGVNKCLLLDHSAEPAEQYSLLNRKQRPMRRVVIERMKKKQQQHQELLDNARASALMGR